MLERPVEASSQATAAVVLDARQSLHLPLEGVKLIEASAGTGKTYAIANLYLRHVLQGRRVSEILVVTFTNAATEELRGRIRQRLYDSLRLVERVFAAADGEGVLQAEPRAEVLADVTDDFLSLLLRQLEDPDQVRNLLKLAVRTMDEAAIYTIHGFCQRALTDHAFHSGQAFQLELSSDDSLLWQQALKDWWRRTSYELDEHACALFSGALGSLEQFIRRQSLLREARDKHILPQDPQPVDELLARWKTLPALLQEITAQWRERHEEIKDILLGSPALSRTQKNGYKPEDLQLYFSGMDDYFSSDSPPLSPNRLRMLSADHLDACSTPKKRGSDSQLQDPFFQACARLLSEVESVEAAFRISALLEATAFARQQIEKMKQASGSMSFSDQLTRLHDALHGAQGEVLGRQLRQAFPVAMIDEFQDTDAIQYGIFRTLYFQGGTAVSSLIMIGDPKQAIYSFRGGDIFTYMQARRDAAGERYTLDTNWRSVPRLINAVNTLLGRRPDTFVYADDIEFLPVKAAAASDEGQLSEAGRPATALTIWQLPLDIDSKPLSKSRLEPMLHQSVADEIARLIAAGRRGEAQLGEKPVQAGDIAVLVRSARQGTGLRQELSRRGINAVTVGRDKVFESDEALGLLGLVAAVIHCTDRSLLRNALSSSLLGYSYAEIAAVIDDEQAWLEWSARMRHFHRLWLRKGFMSMFHAMLQELSLGQRLAAGRNAERRLTNVLHLSELLQQSARSHSGLEALLSWFRQQIHDAAAEETELRMESDEALVKIVTIHASKGLEYPIVFVPYLWSCMPNEPKSPPLLFHDEQGRACIDLLAPLDQAHLLRAEKERLAEDMRLLYVALTRARVKVYLAWGKAERHSCSGRTALAWLLYPTQTAADLDSSFPEALPDKVDLLQPLLDLQRDSGGDIELVDMPTPAGSTRLIDTQEAAGELSAARFSGQIATDWRIASFSALTRDVHQAPHSGAARASSSDPILNYPAGSHVGLFLHSLLEETDFQGDIQEQLLRIYPRYASRYGLDHPQLQGVVLQWLGQVINTPLMDNFSLAHLPNARRLNELAFDFSVQKARIQTLNSILSERAMVPLQDLDAADFRGMITGVIDLVFEHEGRFYIADYKSNFLGGSLQDYAPARLRQAVLERRYDLQYLIYSLALQRYLRQRLGNYSWEEHFGGVFYLFLRGMRSSSGARYGVYFERPDKALLDQLDTAVFPAGSSAGVDA